MDACMLHAYMHAYMQAYMHAYEDSERTCMHVMHAYDACMHACIAVANFCPTSVSFECASNNLCDVPLTAHGEGRAGSIISSSIKKHSPPTSPPSIKNSATHIFYEGGAIFGVVAFSLCLVQCFCRLELPSLKNQCSSKVCSKFDSTTPGGAHFVNRKFA